MNKTLKKVILGFVLPVIAIYILGRISIWFGLGAFILYIAAGLFLSRVTVYSLIGSRKYAIGDMDAAIKWFSKANQSKKAGVKTSISLAYLLLKNGELPKSEEILTKLLKDYSKSPELPKIKSNMALVLWKKGEVEQAVSMLEDVMTSYKTTSVYGSLGYLLILKGDLDKALQFNLEAYEYNSSDKIIQDNLGQNYLFLGMYDKAKEIYEPLVGNAPTFPEPYYNYGLLLEKLGDTEAALEMMKKALDYKFSYLSSIKREEVEEKIKQLSSPAL